MSEEDPRNQKTINSNSFQGLADTAGQSYWAVIIWIFEVFSWLGTGYDGGYSLQESGISPVSQILLKTFRRHWREASEKHLPSGIGNITCFFCFFPFFSKCFMVGPPLTLVFTDHVRAFFHWISSFYFWYIFVPTILFVGMNDLSCFYLLYTILL